MPFKTPFYINVMNEGIRIWKKRHSSDYDDFVYSDKEMTDEYTPKAEAFIQAIKELLEGK